ncbi:hypothetical protein [Sulfurospirillum arcachonense]|uniref:hypothetical protein n=1 Tax=Sulfurospirillum arcachonense TaxID=57666 RepID=UPI00046AC7B5|nr:hypothetical protein [Sulfurospirillum arcachonense]
MIRTISKLSKIEASKNSSNPMRFNGSLPINIVVLKTLTMNRYKLLLGSREFTTKSQKKLESGAKYWGNFGESKNGIITISNLVKKPNFLQNDENFLDIDVMKFLEELIKVESPLSTLKEWLLENLANEETQKDTFKLFSEMLLALKEGIIHLPLKQKEKANLLQIRLAPNHIEFYCAYENLGPIIGTIDDEILDLKVLFHKTHSFLTKELRKSKISANISINQQIEPLYTSDKLILDLKG